MMFVMCSKIDSAGLSKSITSSDHDNDHRYRAHLQDS